MTGGTVLVVIALSLFLFHMWKAQMAGEAANMVLGELETQISVETEEDTDSLPVVEIDGYYYIGYLSIPSLGLTLPIMQEWSEEGLEIAPGVYAGSVLTDDAVIAGHNYRRHFSRIKYVAEGTEIGFTDIAGRTYTYEVLYIETLQPDQVEEMTEKSEDDEWDLTLFTCDSTGSARCVIRCVKI